MSLEELVNMQNEIKGLSDEFDTYHVDWLGAKVRFINLSKNLKLGVATPSQQEIPQTEASAQLTEENASAADEKQPAEETKEIRATASVVPKEFEPNSSAPLAPTPTPILSSASDMKKTKAAEHAAVKKKEGTNFIRFFSPKEDDATDKLVCKPN